MSLKKIISPNGETKWDVRIYEDGRDSKRQFRRFDRKIDAENFIQDTKEAARKKKEIPSDQYLLMDGFFWKRPTTGLKMVKFDFHHRTLNAQKGSLKNSFRCTASSRWISLRPNL